MVALHLNDADWPVRAFAARTMGRQKSSRATAYLLGAFRDGNTAVVVNAIRAVHRHLSVRLCDQRVREKRAHTNPSGGKLRCDAGAYNVINGEPFRFTLTVVGAGPGADPPGRGTTFLSRTS